MKSNRIKKVNSDNAGNVTIIHSNGTFHYNENDVVHKEWTNSFFCRFDIDYQSNWQRFIFWNWVLSICFGLFFLFIGMELCEIPMLKRREGFSEGFSELILIGMNRWYYILPLFLFTYIGFRWIYFMRYRDFFSKDLVFISLKSNQNILLKGERKGSIFSMYSYKDLLQKILPITENIRVFDDRKNNGVKLIGEYIAAILFFSITFYFIYSEWGENSLSNPFPNAETYILKDLSKKELNNLTSAEQFEYEQKQLKSRKEYEIVSKKWELKFANEQIPFYYFLSLGYVFPLITGVVTFVCLSLFGLFIFFTAYLVFWPLGYSFNRLQSRRDLYKILENKFTYPIITILFVISIVTNQLLTNDILSTLVLFLIPIAAPFFFALFISIATIPPDGLIREFFTKSYWKFLFTGKNVFTSEHSFLNLVLMITIPWLILFYHGFNYGKPETLIQEVILAICLFIVSLRLLFRTLSPIGLEFWGVRQINIQNKRYLNLYKNDFLSIQTLVKSNGFKLEFASERLKDNNIIVEYAVKNNGLALQFASEDLKNDKEIVLEAIKSNREAIQFASENLKNDPEILALLNEVNSEK